jgi:DNA replication licensing factor MCM6
VQLSSDARKLLVDSYVALRRGDTAPGSRVAYRMTVRQLEALIRLSEAIARSYLEIQVPVRVIYLELRLIYMLFLDLKRRSYRLNHTMSV